jgi:hypothetical protein
MGFARRLILLGSGIFIIIVSVIFVILMAPFQTTIQDAPVILSQMSAYTAEGALGVIVGAYLIIVSACVVFVCSIPLLLDRMSNIFHLLPQ